MKSSGLGNHFSSYFFTWFSSFNLNVSPLIYGNYISKLCLDNCGILLKLFELLIHNRDASVAPRKLTNYDYAKMFRSGRCFSFSFRGFRSTKTVVETKRSENLDKLVNNRWRQWKGVMFVKIKCSTISVGSRTRTLNARFHERTFPSFSRSTSRNSFISEKAYVISCQEVLQSNPLKIVDPFKFKKVFL